MPGDESSAVITRRGLIMASTVSVALLASGKTIWEAIDRGEPLLLLVAFAIILAFSVLLSHMEARYYA